jgi:hypothetical protein
MRRQIRCLAEGFVTRLTTVGFFSGVGSHVGFEGARPCVGFPTDATEVHFALHDLVIHFARAHGRSPSGPKGRHGVKGVELGEVVWRRAFVRVVGFVAEAVGVRVGVRVGAARGGPELRGEVVGGGGGVGLRGLVGVRGVLRSPGGEAVGVGVRPLLPVPVRPRTHAHVHAHGDVDAHGGEEALGCMGIPGVLWRRRGWRREVLRRRGGGGGGRDPGG